MFVIRPRMRVLLGVSLVAAMSLLSATGSLLSAQQLGPQTDRADVLIGFRSTPDAADEALVRAAGGEIRHRFHNVAAIAAPVPRAASRPRRRRRRGGGGAPIVWIASTRSSPSSRTT